jgi:hypothetical protein
MDLAVYTVMSGLRGPDITTEGLLVVKREITARLRHVAGVEETPLLLCCSKPLDEKGLEAVKGALSRTSEWVESLLLTKPEAGEVIAYAVLHYLDHTSDAVAFSAHHDVWGGLASKVIEAISRCTRKIRLEMVTNDEPGRNSR